MIRKLSTIIQRPSTNTTLRALPKYPNFLQSTGFKFLFGQDYTTFQNEINAISNNQKELTLKYDDLLKNKNSNGSLLPIDQSLATSDTTNLFYGINWRFLKAESEPFSSFQTLAELLR